MPIADVSFSQKSPESNTEDLLITFISKGSELFGYTN